MDQNIILLPIFAVKVWLVVLIVVTVVLAALLVALSIYGKKLQSKQEKTEKDLKEASQSVSLLVIDKKRMKLREAGLPPIVLEQTPKYLRGQKVPIVKAKIGPKIMSLICDEKVFDLIPVKKEVKARVSGIYITDVKGVHTNLEAKPRKKKLSDRAREMMSRKK